LLDDPVAADSARERAQLLVDDVDFLGRQMSELLETDEAARVEQVGELRADALDAQEIVGRFRAVGKMAVDRRADLLAGHVACRRRDFGCEVFLFASPIARDARHVRPQRRAVGVEPAAEAGAGARPAMTTAPTINVRNINVSFVRASASAPCLSPALLNQRSAREQCASATR
jgi:hypothetical protein